MKPPRIPPLITDLVQTAISLFDSMEFSEIQCCPECRGDVQGYDFKEKRFAVLRDNDKERAIRVRVKRFICRDCGKLCYADEPFYPDTRVGAPVVDLCMTFGATMPGSRVATYLSYLGIIIDRGSALKYAGLSLRRVNTAEVFHLMLPMSVLTLPSLSARVAQGGGRITGAEALAACGFPSAYRSAPGTAARQQERDDRDKEDKEQDRQPEHPQDDGDKN